MPLDDQNLQTAIKTLREKSGKRNFTQSIELIVNLRDVDPKKPEGKFQELLTLPHPPGKANKVCVIASGDMAVRARGAGADLVIERGELEALAGDKKRQRELAETYDSFIAEAPLMPLVGRALGATLAPRGKMPIPVPPNADVKEQIGGRRRTVLLRLRGQPTIQCRVGGEGMPDAEIAENVQAAVRVVEGKLKRGMGNVRAVYLKATMGPPVRVQV